MDGNRCFRGKLKYVNNLSWFQRHKEIRISPNILLKHSFKHILLTFRVTTERRNMEKIPSKLRKKRNYAIYLIGDKKNGGKNQEKITWQIKNKR